MLFEVMTVLGAGTNTNDTVRLAAPIKALRYMDNPLEPQSSFWERFKSEIGRNGPRITIQKFGYPSTFKWARQSMHEGYGRRKIESEGEDLFGSIFSDSALDALTAGIDFHGLKEDRKTALAFGAKFVEGSLNTTEPHLGQSSVEPVEIGWFHEWIHGFVKKDRTRYGLKLLNSNPYGYLSVAFGRNRNHMPFLVSNTRARVMLSSSKIGTPRIDEELLFPVNPETQFSIGCRFYPTMMDESDSQPALTTRFTREIGYANSGNVLYASAYINGYERLGIIGISFNW
ncbi:MAG: hypothetical protein A3C79_02355 [Candidatus Taylorbacteria bacterium RIFCSPHIGHO2_02_FULL_45_28]|uniref:Uncharacterized protein n=1 Tax=Candidatus Taylorbacteria bacterium RIFCSPHIGHO2_12_FULL_45_16 TaxID=1802315 RepID=A0A1G2MXX2_9BACT|nr:MAG: hypothetical protein A2830_03165 [Candidatus Taylorbacteria bacterium RIFCSPHIGHO2_01_FULL_44_110]OHA25297.1 MAG: hypothetical protein A3C79_02355 [Candidatus Taylorbacteria bacterium RIFCSPHIGHO2_02_FULL_45_28]OHA28684.1 MAG: hypothetical protein A3F51_02825 [Candidatus Taylorbacteria bacterium RIFCSPHIGHO2_12_FULL_45_16]OHA32957.1 MAG: hypothetical protein A3A23_01000 [Candidatus Taylorbacteria bacterium RIFCSPLOWO2_01_FULL_45_59]OHA38446.1 MAG: hypothetical protein A3I98_00500 [Candi